MFEKANRLKLRFDSNKGAVTVEDLWDMPLVSNGNFNLDTVAKGVNKHIKTSEEESFVTTTPSKESTINKLKLEILKHIIGVKLTEAQAKEDGVLRKEKREKILKIIADKQDDSLNSKSIEELEELLK